MNTSCVGNSKVSDIPENIQEHQLAFFESEDDVRWSLHLSDQIMKEQEDLSKLIFDLKAALFHLETIEDEIIEEKDIGEVWDMVETLRTLTFHLDEAMEEKEPDAPGKQTEIGDAL